jgi:CARDB/FG-GAP-like repeat
MNFRMLGVICLAVGGMVGCSGHSSSHSGGEDLSVPGDLGAGSDGGSGEDLSVAPDLASCPSQLLCGPTLACCPAGDECVDDTCLPTCPAARCGTGCCTVGDVCLYGACVAPGADCKDSVDCDDGFFCEPTLDKCLPQAPSADGGSSDGGGGALCEYRPPVAPYNPVLEWSWTDSTIKPGYNQVINMPVVMDLDNDTIPDVVIVTSLNTDHFNQTDPAYLRALDGKTGKEKWPSTADVYLDANRVNPRGTPAAADLDGSGAIKIVALRQSNGLEAFNADGSLFWQAKQADGVTNYTGSFNSGTVAIADLDHDGKAEIVVGGVVFDHTGKLVFGAGNEHAGENATNYGAVSIVADVDDSGNMEVLTGRIAFQYPSPSPALWNCVTDAAHCGYPATPNDGYTAISDLDNNGTPELIVVANGKIRVQNARTGQKITDEHPLPGSGKGGPPTVADFDGDGHMDISSANGDHYNVFGFEPSPSPHIVDKWSQPTQDLSSNVTGSSVFDFEGDGKAEVVYGDECYFRVYRGSDGFVLYQSPSSSATIHEYPVLVDVDGDNRTEVVVVSNDANHVSGSVTCPGYTGTDAPRHGVFVYRDANNKWVRTRKLWNEHPYHIVNVASDGKIPHPETDSWKSFNNYRVSAQGAGVFNAPDLAVDIEVSTASCPDAITLRAHVKNLGSLGVAAGVSVDFYLGTDATGTLIQSAVTTQALLPGESQDVTVQFPTAGQTPPFNFFVVVDGGATSASKVNECNEDNNGAGTPQVACPSIG